MFGLGAGEVILILLFALIFIGPKKLPELAKGLGKGIREFQKAKDDLMNEVKSSTVDQLTESESTKTSETPPQVSDKEIMTPEGADCLHHEEEEDDIARANREQKEDNDPDSHGDYEPPLVDETVTQINNNEKEEKS
jgi:sec-independent protein translocase protein TatA